MALQVPILALFQFHPSSSLAAHKVNFVLCFGRASAVTAHAIIVVHALYLVHRASSRQLPVSNLSMRRSAEDLQRRFGLREMRGISDADGEGYLYAYVDSDGWKIGMSNNFVRRQEEWDKDCPSPWRIWLPPIQVANRRRAETLAHLLLEMECVDRPRIYCQNWLLFREESSRYAAEQALNGRIIRCTKLQAYEGPQALEDPQDLSKHQDPTFIHMYILTQRITYTDILNATFRYPDIRDVPTF
ncbi:hypothetical protein F5879DRAFT_927058 [Lentinula edodes]|nr:hypothetical protein F5879DRAFT_927058 [Lentinula edodes]